jgi:hypothetical protein
MACSLKRCAPLWPHQALNLVSREQPLSWRQRDAVGWHAVSAAQVAALGQGDAEVSVLPAAGPRGAGVGVGRVG